MAKGPLAVRWGRCDLADPQAGSSTTAEVELENTGTITWHDTVYLAYHWLDARDNAIVWDGARTPVPPVPPGETVTITATVIAPIPPGRYRFAPDLVVEHRAWLSELGSPFRSQEVEVGPRRGAAHSDLPAWVAPATDWAERVAAAHAEGYGVVAGAIDWNGGLAHRRPQALLPYATGPGRVASFPHPLLCPSVLEGIELDRLPDIAGLPAFAAPSDDTWLYDGRIILQADPRRKSA